MQEISSTHAIDETAAPRGLRRLSRRSRFLLWTALAIVVLVLVPPLVSVSRYQRRIANSMSAVLGRPVHMDRVALNLLPLPGFTISNLVIEEDPAFGSEPIIRSQSVRVTLRASSLWRRRVEFSTISFADPSVNLVHGANGRWNLESVLLQAAHIETAPTTQRRPGASPRFPYIEATGARVNVKFGVEKMPLSLTEADFALWLPNPRQWKMRIQGRPVRTDTNASDTGIVQIEATLGRAHSLGAVPAEFTGAWRKVQLGEASRILTGHDAGLRGEATVTAETHGTLGAAALTTTLHVESLRRAEFVPQRTLSMDLACAAEATQVFHTFNQIRCNWPVPASAGARVGITGDVGDIHDVNSIDLQIRTARLPASTLLDWARVLSSRIPGDLTATGTLAGSLSRENSGRLAKPTWSGQAQVKDLVLGGPAGMGAPFEIGFVTLQAVAPAHGSSRPESLPSLRLIPINLNLGGRDPASLEGSMDLSGYTMRLSGPALLPRLLALSTAVPQLGDGLPEILPEGHTSGPVRLNLSATRSWSGGQTWTDLSASPSQTAAPIPARTHPGNSPH